MQPARNPMISPRRLSQTYRRLRSSRERGFTLVELMVVVVLVGILATLALVAMRRWLITSKSVEAMHVIQGIRGGEERFRSENMVYLDVSTSGTLYPAVAPNRTKYNWVQSGHADYTRWRLLNPTVSTSVQHGYMVRAGRALTAPTAAMTPGIAVTWPAAANVNDAWYVIYAQGDLDADGTAARYATSSFTSEIVRVNEGE